MEQSKIIDTLETYHAHPARGGLFQRDGGRGWRDACRVWCDGCHGAPSPRDRRARAGHVGSDGDRRAPAVVVLFVLFN